MRFIRVFLWGLVAAMTLQGFLHADEYGSAISFFGGVSLTLSVWKENLWSQVRALVPGSSSTNSNGLPRALVMAALQESARHPALHTLPTLKKALSEHRRAWDTFREEEVQWMLSHADIIGALRAEGHSLWQPAWSEHALLEQRHAMLAAQQCSIPVGVVCAERKASLAQAHTNMMLARQKVHAWNRLLEMDSSLPLVEWWNLTMGSITPHQRTQFDIYETALATLHNITYPSEARVKALRTNASAIATAMGGRCRWLTSIVRSLLLRDLWAACLSHIHRRESRVQEMLVATGVQDLYNTHERLLAASLRSVNAADAITVQGWFDAIASYAWWLSEDVPSIVRRCIGQTAGECRRIGVTEISSLMSQFDERQRIVKDWTRCLFIGMWNAMPAVGLLFIVELVVLLIPQRHVHTIVSGNGEGMTRLLENAPRRARSASVGAKQPRLKMIASE